MTKKQQLKALTAHLHFIQNSEPFSKDRNARRSEIWGLRIKLLKQKAK